jgi:hypothetical protein
VLTSPGVSTPASQNPYPEKGGFQFTRELELLISAALVFSLLRLPELLDEWWDANFVHVDGYAFTTIWIIYYVGKLVSYAFVAAMTGHFILRGLWVGVLGLQSAFPGGADHERLHHGPFLRRFYAKRLASLDELDERVDRIAASIFGFVFMFILLFAVAALTAGIAFVIALGMARLTGSDRVVGPTFAVLFLLPAAGSLFLNFVDRRSRTGNLSPRMEAFAEKLMRFLHYATLNFLYAPLFLTFTTRLSKKLVTTVQMVFMYSLIAIFIVNMLAARGVLGFDSYNYFPTRTGKFDVRSAHYEDRRRPGAVPVIPTIQSDVIEGPYVRLFIPYDGREDSARIRQICPDVAPVRDEGVYLDLPKTTPEPRSRELLACFAKLYTIQLDDKPMTDLRFSFYTNPETRVPGRLAMIPTAGLAAGQHTLAIRHTPLPGGQKDRRRDEFFIHFWR